MHSKRILMPILHLVAYYCTAVWRGFGIILQIILFRTYTFICDNKMFNREKSLITQGWVKIRKEGWGSTTDHNDQNIMYIKELVSNLQLTTKEIGLPIPLLSCQVACLILMNMNIKVIVYLSLYTHLSMKYNWYR